MSVKIVRKSQRPKPGDVIQIPLPNGRFAYGRLYKDASIAIYGEMSDRPLSPPIGSRQYAFVVGIYREVLTSGDWPRIGHDPFQGTEDMYPPPMSIKDPITGAYSIYHKGHVIPASDTECIHLEPAAAWNAHHVIERIMKQDACRWPRLLSREQAAMANGSSQLATVIGHPQSQAALSAILLVKEGRWHDGGWTWQTSRKSWWPGTWERV